MAGCLWKTAKIKTPINVWAEDAIQPDTIISSAFSEQFISGKQL